ncbi:hypothetical protein L0666_16505 [Octadecabacter sp. CECT 8868]|nr:hypothetical protein [Octadecabacter algicola]
MRIVSLVSMLIPLTACAAVPITPERAAEICEEKARAAQGPTGSASVGANSETGAYSGLEISLSSDFLAGRDPNDVYAECIYDRTGAAPIRPLVLR